MELSAKQFVQRLETHRSDAEKAKYERIFKRDGDVFIGVRMGQVFALAKEFIDMPSAEIEKLLESPVHEVRAGGMSIMGKSAASKKTPKSRLKELFMLYLKRHDRINDWDLVDLGAQYVVGGYLADQPRDVLYKLARSNNMWERRTAIVSTFHFVRKGELDDTFAIAELLVGDDEDLVHKAVGWALREAGKHDPPRLRGFLDRHAATMPRVMLRYAIEHFEKDERTRYQEMKKKR